MKAFKVWLESNDIRISWISSDGNEVRIVYPNGVYEYRTDYGPAVLKLLRQNRYRPGKFANELRKMVDKGYAKVEKIHSSK